MNNKTADPVPQELVTHVTAICGQSGLDWLRGLPETVSRLEKNWDVSILYPFPGIEFNFVAAAIRNNKEPVVVKIAPPYENGEFLGEAAFLRSRNGIGTVQLLAEDRPNSAMLLERALPGENLTQVFRDRETDCVAPAIDVLKKISRLAPAELIDVIILDDWIDGLRRHSSTLFPKRYAEKALGIYDGILKTKQCYYLHGDFHPGNIVAAHREPFLAIDPKGIIGPIGYEMAVFLNNYHWWQETLPDIGVRLKNAIAKFANAFDIDPREIRQWAYVQMVLSAWWTFDEMPEIYDNEVAKADIWDI
jgi:streptomycin 6-kinase